MGFSSVLNRSLHLILKNPRFIVPQLLFFLAIAAILSLSTVIAYLLFFLPAIASGKVTVGVLYSIRATFYSMYVLAIAVSLFIGPLLSGMVIELSNNRNSKGSLKEALYFAMKNYGKLLQTNSIAMLIGGLLFMSIAYIATSGFTYSPLSTLDTVPLFGYAFIALLGFGIVYYFLFYQALVVVISENRRGLDAIRRGIALNLRRPGSVVGIFASICAFGALVYAPVQLFSLITQSQVAIGFSIAIGGNIPMTSVLNQFLINALQAFAFAFVETWLLVSGVFFYDESAN